MKKNRLFVVVSISVAILGFTGCTKKAPPNPSAPVPQKNVAAPSGVDAALAKVKIAPNFENYTDLGFAYAQDKKHKEALDAYTKAAEMNPESAIAQNNLCAEWIEFKSWKKAEAACEHALRIDPQFERAANNLSFIQQFKMQVNAAIGKQKESLQKAKGNEKSQLLLDVGLGYYHLQDFGQANQYWSQVKKGDPLYGSALNNLATINIHERKFPQAEKQINEALTLEPRNQLFINNKNWLEEEKKK